MEAPVADTCGNRHEARTWKRCYAVLHGVLDDRLEHERRHQDAARGLLDLEANRKPRTETNPLDVEVSAHEIELALERDLVQIAAIENGGHQVGQPHDHGPCQRRVVVYQREERVERIEHEVRLKLRSDDRQFEVARGDEDPGFAALTLPIAAPESGAQHQA